MEEVKRNFLLKHLQNEISLGRTIDAAKFELLRAGMCSMDEADELLLEFKKRLDDNLNLTGCVLRNSDSQREKWYQGPLEREDSQWMLLKNYLKFERSLSDFDIQSIDAASTTIVANISCPFPEKPQIVKGLVVGHVQSGKTTNYSAVITKAVDAGYRLIVVLAGIHNGLRLQTEKRLQKEICALKPDAATNLTKVDEKGDFSRQQTLRAERALSRQDGYAIAVLKKNAHVLRTFDMWLSEATPETLQNCPILIIDDEADFASINTNDVADEPTTINNLVRTIFKRFKTSSYVGYTATPYANIFIDSGADDDLFPRDFLVSLERPISYFGPEELFGSEALEKGDGKKPLPVIRFIADDEAARYSLTRKRDYKPSHFATIGDSLREAILSFFIAGGIRISRRQWNEHITMLIHTSNLTDMHNKMFELVDDFIKELQIASCDGLHSIKEEIKEIFDTDFDPICKSMSSSEPLSFDILWKQVCKFVPEVAVVIENSKSADRLTFEGDRPLWGIIIGGNTLSRGLTLEGLTISYYVRNARGYDTLMQMGRWFGYRPNYADVTRVFVTQDLYSKFFHLANVENELREEIKALAENDEKPIDVALRIRKHPDMLITSNLKMRSATEASLTYSGIKIQERYLRLNDSGLLKNNFEAVLALLKGVNRLKIPESKSIFKDFEAYLLYKGVPSELILQLIDSYKFSAANIKFSSSILKSYIYDQNQLNELTNWSVAVISSKTGTRLDLPGIREIYKVQRSVIPTVVSDLDRNASYLTALSPPQDELIDLDIKQSVDGANIDSITDYLKSINKSWSAVRMSMRPKDQGLLLLYPLERELANHSSFSVKSDNRLAPLQASYDLFGVTIVFPKSQNSKKTYAYVINGTI